MRLTARTAQALALAIEAHDGQVRKGTTIPYIAHPMGVASLALSYGADEDQTIAALLHDTLEDGGPQYVERIREQFGDNVLRLVEGCTDELPDAGGRKAPWEARKRRYLAHLNEASDDVLLVSGCDKLYNARAIVGDLLAMGQAVFDRFTAGREQTLWYYQNLAAVYMARGTAMAEALHQEVERMRTLAGVPESRAETDGPDRDHRGRGAV